MEKRLASIINQIGADGVSRSLRILENVLSWEDMRQRLPVPRMFPCLVCNHYRRVRDGVTYSEWYVRKQ